MNMVNHDACSPGQYYDLVKGCRFCSLINSMYQEMLCPCEPFRDAVVACKLVYEGSVLCRPRNSALEECAKRGYTSSLAPRTAASADSTVVPSVASSGSGSTSALQGESTQLRFATSADIDNLPSSTSLTASEILISSFSVCFIGLLLCAAVVGILWIRQRRKMYRHRKAKYEDEKRELSAIRANLIDKEPVAWHGDVNGIGTPQAVIINGATPDVDPKPSSVVNNFNIVVKDSQFTQVGSKNVMNVAELVAGVAGSAGDCNNDEEEQVSPASGSSDPGDENGMVFDNASNSYVFWDAGFSHLPAEQPEFTQFAPVVQSGITDHLEEGDAYPRNLENNTETEKHGTSHGSQSCGIENALRDSSSLPTQNTDSFSHQMNGTAKLPVSQPTGVSSSSIHHGPLPSTAGDRYDAPTVSESVRRTSGTTLTLSLTSQSSVPLSKGGQCSLNSRDDSNGCLLVRPSARKSVSAGRSSLLTSPVQNSDKEPNLPLQTAPLHSLPLGISGGHRQIVSPV